MSEGDGTITVVTSWCDGAHTVLCRNRRKLWRAEVGHSLGMPFFVIHVGSVEYWGKGHQISMPV